MEAMLRLNPQHPTPPGPEHAPITDVKPPHTDSSIQISHFKGPQSVILSLQYSGPDTRSHELASPLSDSTMHHMLEASDSLDLHLSISTISDVSSSNSCSDDAFDQHGFYPESADSNSSDSQQRMTTTSQNSAPLISSVQLIQFLAGIVGSDIVAPVNKTIVDKCVLQLTSLLETVSAPTTQKVVNLSDKVLNSHELNLLEKGLKFCPTPGEPLLGDLVRDLDWFHNNLRWEYHFKDNPLLRTPFDKLIMTSKAFRRTHRALPSPAHKNLEAFIFLNERDLQTQKLMEPHAKNLTLGEKTALKSLKNDPHITIKQADKGGALVLMNTRDYIEEAERQLSDRQHYCPVDHDLTDDFSSRIEKYLTSLYQQGIISKITYTRVSTSKPCTPAFYHNPKIHKNNTHLGIPLGRPIISGNGCATERILALVDLCLNPLVPLIPSYVKDSTHFITLFQEHVESHPCTDHTPTSLKMKVSRRSRNC